MAIKNLFVCHENVLYNVRKSMAGGTAMKRATRSPLRLSMIQFSTFLYDWLFLKGTVLHHYTDVYRILKADLAGTEKDYLSGA